MFFAARGGRASEAGHRRKRDRTPGRAAAAAGHPRGKRAGAARGGRGGLRRAGLLRRDDRRDRPARRGAEGQPALLFRHQGGALPRRGRAGADRLARRRRPVRRQRRPARGARRLYGAKMDLARAMPLALAHLVSRDHARRADDPGFPRHHPHRLGRSREKAVKRWIAAGRLSRSSQMLFYMIWATTQQYANAAHEMATLNGGARSTTGRSTGRKRRRSRLSCAGWRRHRGECSVVATPRPRQGLWAQKVRALRGAPIEQSMACRCRLSRDDDRPAVAPAGGVVSPIDDRRGFAGQRGPSAAVTSRHRQKKDKRRILRA